jgi:hypothetical protein
MPTQVGPDHPAALAARREVRSRLANEYARFILTKLWRGGGEFDPGAVLRVSDIRALSGAPEFQGRPAATIRAMVAAEFRSAVRSCKVKAAFS